MHNSIPKTGHSTIALFLLCLATAAALAPVRARSLPPQSPPTEAEQKALFDRVVENQKRDDAAIDLFERIERTETRKVADISQPADVKIVRAFPVGTGTNRIPVGPDGKPVDAAAYRRALGDLEHALVLATQDGGAQREAYAKIAKRRRDRDLLIDATRSAFLFTWISEETRDGRRLAKYRMDPNPSFKPTSRSTAIFTKVNGIVWIDTSAAELARIEVQVADDISIGGILAKIYKGSHFMQERYEVDLAVWLPTFSQNDFDGRKFFSSVAIHDRTFFTRYRRVGPPAEAVAHVRAELGNPAAASGNH